VATLLNNMSTADLCRAGRRAAGADDPAAHQRQGPRGPHDEEIVGASRTHPRTTDAPNSAPVADISFGAETSVRYAAG
jgi:hypothetical protein